MAITLTATSDALRRCDIDPGWRIGWKHGYRFQRRHLDGGTTRGEAARTTAALQAGDPEKAGFPEIIPTATQV